MSVFAAFAGYCFWRRLLEITDVMYPQLIVDRQHALPAAVTLNLAPFKALRNLIVSVATEISLFKFSPSSPPPPLPSPPLPPSSPPHQLRKIPLHLVTGLQRLRGQLQSLAVQRCQVGSLEDVIVRCGGDDSASFAWNSLKELDLSNNSITSLGDCLVCWVGLCQGGGVVCSTLWCVCSNIYSFWRR